VCVAELKTLFGSDLCDQDRERIEEAPKPVLAEVQVTFVDLFLPDRQFTLSGDKRIRLASQ
jgi:hypothetical protein